MAEISKERIEEFKKIAKEDYGKELSDKEAYEQAHNLVHFFELLLEIEQKERQRKARLEKEPRSFALEGQGYTCCVCDGLIYEKEAWYDKYGIKCPHCQKAIEENHIPKKVCKDRDSFYLGWELKSKFSLHPQTAAKMVREGKLKERIVRTKDGKGVHCHLYLKKDNLNLK